MTKKANNHTLPLPSAAASIRYERFNLALIYANSLVFAGMFSAESFAAYLVKAVFNGSGIIMVSGLLGLIVGNLWAYFGHSEATYQWGAHLTNIVLFFIQCGLLVAFSAMVIIKYLQ